MGQFGLLTATGGAVNLGAFQAPFSIVFCSIHIAMHNVYGPGLSTCIQVTALAVSSSTSRSAHADVR